MHLGDVLNHRYRIIANLVGLTLITLTLEKVLCQSQQTQNTTQQRESRWPLTASR